MSQIVTTQREVATPTQEEIVKHFINTQDVKESSKRLYSRTLKQFTNWAKDKGLGLDELKREDILEYKTELLDRGMSSLSVGSYLTVVRKFYTWTEARLIYPNVAKGIKTPRRKQQFRKQPLSPSQGQALLSYYEDKALRDYALTNLLIRTGLRTIEASRANVEDITFKQGRRVLLVWGKGRDERDNFVILTDKAWEPIEKYLNKRGQAKGGEPLFISSSNNSKGERLSTRTISGMVKGGLQAIGLDNKHFTAHSLRHTTAVNILKAGGSLEDAQGVLRHTSPSTTQIYTHTIREEMRLKKGVEELLDAVF